MRLLTSRSRCLLAANVLVGTAGSPEALGFFTGDPERYDNRLLFSTLAAAPGVLRLADFDGAQPAPVRRRGRPVHGGARAPVLGGDGRRPPRDLAPRGRARAPAQGDGPQAQPEARRPPHGDARRRRRPPPRGHPRPRRRRRLPHHRAQPLGQPLPPRDVARGAQRAHRAAGDAPRDAHRRGRHAHREPRVAGPPRRPARRGGGQHGEHPRRRRRRGPEPPRAREPVQRAQQRAPPAQGRAPRGARGPGAGRAGEGARLLRVAPQPLARLAPARHRRPEGPARPRPGRPGRQGGPPLDAHPHGEVGGRRAVALGRPLRRPPPRGLARAPRQDRPQGRPARPRPLRGARRVDPRALRRERPPAD